MADICIDIFTYSQAYLMVCNYRNIGLLALYNSKSLGPFEVFPVLYVSLFLADPGKPGAALQTLL